MSVIDLSREQIPLVHRTAADALYVEPFEFDPFRDPYWLKPADWAADNIRWPNGAGLVYYQDEILNELAEFSREAVVSLHGAGKTTTESIAILWYAETRNRARRDWKIPTTASKWRQLTHFLWPEVHKWARSIKWEKLGVQPWRRGRELLDMAIKLEFGEAFAVASDEPAAIEGAHADHMLYIVDEAKTIPSATFDAIEGAFSTAGGPDGTEALALVTSTPGGPSGRFFEIHARNPGLENWHTKHIGLEEALKAHRVTLTWAEQNKRLWGERSALYRNRVLGEFAGDDEYGVIPLAWVEAANERWTQFFGDRARPRDQNLGTPSVLSKGEPIGAVGVDVATTGADKSVLALRIGNAIAELRRFPYTEDTMELAGFVVGIQRGHSMLGAEKRREFPNAVVDSNGVGAGVFNRIQEQKLPAEAFVASAGTKMLDISGEFGFVNKRAAAWWNLREMLDPDSGLEVAIPPDDRLTGDLVAPKWRSMSGGRIQIEAKEDIRKRIGRSTDDADAVVQAFWSERGQGAAFLEYWRGETMKRGGKSVDLIKPKGGQQQRAKRKVEPVIPEEFDEQAGPNTPTPIGASQRALNAHVDREERRRVRLTEKATQAQSKCAHLRDPSSGVCRRCGQADPRRTS